MAVNQINLIPKFNDVSKQEQELVKEIVQKNMESKMDSYLKKIFSKSPDTQLRIRYTITFHEDTKKYDADFIFAYDGNEFIYKKE